MLSKNLHRDFDSPLVLLCYARVHSFKYVIIYKLSVYIFSADQDAKFSSVVHRDPRILLDIVDDQWRRDKLPTDGPFLFISGFPV